MNTKSNSFIASAVLIFSLAAACGAFKSAADKITEPEGKDETCGQWKLETIDGKPGARKQCEIAGPGHDRLVCGEEGFVPVLLNGGEIVRCQNAEGVVSLVNNKLVGSFVPDRCLQAEKGHAWIHARTEAGVVFAMPCRDMGSVGLGLDPNFRLQCQAGYPLKVQSDPDFTTYNFPLGTCENDAGMLSRPAKGTMYCVAKDVGTYRQIEISGTSENATSCQNYYDNFVWQSLNDVRCNAGKKISIAADHRAAKCI